MIPDIGTTFSEFVRTGAEPTFAHLSEAARPVILSWLTRSRICQSNDAEDVCQETLLAIWVRYSGESNPRRLSDFQPPRFPTTQWNNVAWSYLFTVAKQKALRARRNAREIGSAIRGNICPVGDMWDVEAEAVVGSSISTIAFEPAPAQRGVSIQDLISEFLPTEVNQLLQERFLEGKTYQEIAAHRGMREAVVKVRIFRAIMRLRETLKPPYPDRPPSVISMSWLSMASRLLSNIEDTGLIPTGSAGNFAAALVRRINLKPRGEISMVDLDQLAQQQNILLEQAHLCVEYLRNKLPSLLKRYFVSAHDGSPVSANLVCSHLSMGVESIEWKNWAANVRVVWRRNANWYSWDLE